MTTSTTSTRTPTTNDVRRFAYAWFTLFEHRAPADRLAAHITADEPRLTFPGGDPLLDRESFTTWYEQLLDNTVWNFHSLSGLVVAAAEDGFSYSVAFDVDWAGGVTAESGWPTNLPGREFRFELHQDWTLRVRSGDPLDDPFEIVTLVATPR